MKTSLTLILVLASATPLALSAADAHHQHHGNQPTTSDDSTAADASELAKAKAVYPLKTCVVSGEEIGGSMGEGVDYLYKKEGQPDRLVRFCCKDCLADFNKEPAKYLKLIDEAAAKAKPSK